MAELPADRFNRLIKDNNLKIIQNPINIREIKDGGLIIDKITYNIEFDDPKKEEV